MRPDPKPTPRPKGPKKRIRRRSKRRSSEEALYNKRRVSFLERNPVCAVTGARATEVHHMKGREGSLLLDEKYWLPVSHDAHVRITEDSKWAIEMGYSLLRTQ